MIPTFGMLTVHKLYFHCNLVTMTKIFTLCIGVTALVLLLEAVNGVPLNDGGSLTSEDFERGRKLLAAPHSVKSQSQFDFAKHEAVLRGEDGNGGEKNAARYRRWSNAQIPYVISPLYTASERSIIAAAIQEYHTKTCVRFVTYTNQVDYLYITPDDGMGDSVSPYCYSYVGKQGQKQFMKMYGECVRLPAMIHELGHAIGFEHEHNRVDRDDYISITWANIDSVYYYAYNKVSSTEYDTLGLPYDYYSTMHYPDYSFAMSGRKAFTLKYPGDVSTENQRLSPTDVQKFNRYYGCA